MQATRTQLSGQRWHFQHGPIDLILSADGNARAISIAIDKAWQRFQFVLEELVAELPQLRAAQGTTSFASVQGAVARRMCRATQPFVPQFITAMAAVAGAVADELIGLFALPGIERAYINNGGDIALMLACGHSYRIGVASETFAASELDRLVIDAQVPVRGIATSGWRGRSFSFGIADRVTTLAADAASADAAATMIGNAVNIDDPLIKRQMASQLKDDTDLGDLFVTVDVPVLAKEQVRVALARGALYAEHLLKRGLIHGALLKLQNQTRAILAPALAEHGQAASWLAEHAVAADGVL